jgi:hypothetical protein
LAMMDHASERIKQESWHQGTVCFILSIGVPLYQEGYHMDCQQSLNAPIA